MSARIGQRRKIYPSKYRQYKDGSMNGNITRILSNPSPPVKSYSKVQTENKVSAPNNKTPREIYSRERGCLRTVINYNNNHVMPAADDKNSFQEMPATDGKQNFQEMPIDECRQVYRDEINTLWREVEDFRITCKKEMVRQRTLLDKHRIECEEALKNGNVSSRAPDVTEGKDYTNELNTLKENMQILEKKQKLLDQEEEIVEREEQLAKRQEKLKEYEKDVEEAEALLDKRQNIAKRRSQDVEFLNHDLLTIKQDLEESISSEERNMDSSETGKTEASWEQTASDTSELINSPETSCKARRNWQLARRHLIDKVTLLETTIQRYRTQVASSSATITAKDMVISRLQKELNMLVTSMISMTNTRIRYLLDYYDEELGEIRKTQTVDQIHPSKAIQKTVNRKTSVQITEVLILNLKYMRTLKHKVTQVL
ncbi:uncharacterized protein LOC128555594 isoform X2 [Mercenaria mercenaria]|uniref:uncharacterized protein LOC128555594 isoform X2 n=1 Tax=Mercenaria mercenaria TaxID=6596 RepID=UPI00234EDDCF|nr:uncharacterized protein LOC128555594 isoform X2 [Mercenaria mercenaria]